MDTIVKAKGLTKQYGNVLAVDHVDLEVFEGEIFGLLGPNGAGKTSTAPCSEFFSLFDR